MMQSWNKNPTRRILRLALLTAVALTIFMIESYIPNLTPIPGIKLGLANIVTVYAMFTMGPGDTLMILLARVILGGVFSGQAMTIAYSLAGGLASFLAMLGLRYLGIRRIWLCSCLSAAIHNAGQLAVAVAITRTPILTLYYLPILVLSGLICGLFTGLCAQLLVTRLKPPSR